MKHYLIRNAAGEHAIVADRIQILVLEGWTVAAEGTLEHCQDVLAFAIANAKVVNVIPGGDNVRLHYYDGSTKPADAEVRGADGKWSKIELWFEGDKVTEFSGDAMPAPLQDVLRGLGYDLSFVVPPDDQPPGVR